MKLPLRLSVAIIATAYVSGPVQAGWGLQKDGETVEVTRAKMKVTPVGDWNRWTARPSKRGEIWTLDGLALNELSFYAKIGDGESLYRQNFVSETQLPTFKSNMLLTDVVEMFEASNRIILQTSLFNVGKIVPAKLDGHDAVRFQYQYVVEGDQLNRNGEAVAAIVDGELYLVNFVAPAIYYFDRDIAVFRQMVDTIRFRVNK